MLSHADNTEDPAPQSLPQSLPQSPPSALRAERLSSDEARAVIDLWQAEQVEQTGLTDRPAVPDVAEGLDLSVEDVQRLLTEVRTRREAESRLLAHEQELAEIRLAEEQRKLAEIQRQRAELARQQAEAERRGELHFLLPLPLPQKDVPGWHGAAAFSPEDEAMELLAAQKAEAERVRKETIPFLLYIALLVLVSVCFYLLARLGQY